ncbi:MAG: hypothetical protein ACPGTG_03810 [Flavobacteriales bacterium]
MTFSKEFKEAVCLLSTKEKDKLLLRLLKKDPILSERLKFELISKDTVDDRRLILKHELLDQIERSSWHEKRYFTLKSLHRNVRYWSSDITYHVKVTADKFGEAYLNLIMISKVLELNNSYVLKVRDQLIVHKFYIAVIARAFKIMILINKLDKDYFMEFEALLKTFGKLINENEHLHSKAKEHGLQLDWLLEADIPENMVEIHKEIKAKGLLK